MFKGYKLKIVVLLIATVFLLIVFPYIKAEFLTNKYGEQFQNLYKQTEMIENIEYLKVVDYDNDLAKVYYVSDNHQSLNVLVFKNYENTWTLNSWNTVWSKSGSADGFIWPYYF